MNRFILAGAIIVLTACSVSAQISIGGSGPQTFRVQGTMGIGNGESCVTVANPNTSGQFLFLFPHMPQLKTGETLPLRLHAVGQEGQTVFVWKLDQAPAPKQDVVAGGEPAQTANVKHNTVLVDIPAMLSGTSQIIRIDIPGIKAGSAVSASPAEELPGMLAIAHASAPVDCVVILKLINPGPFVPGMTMSFSIGAIATLTD
ncbi:MAG: hypothetical protein FGM33_07190 [Candidatus Kapabacteria bacterium]|nr:hypothetical protein [Candidatus Kapabacteria bacterium]